MSNNLFFHNGQGIFEDRQVMFNGEKKVIVRDACSEVEIRDVKTIKVKYNVDNSITIEIGSNAVFHSRNKRIVVNDNKDNIIIEILDTHEQVKKYQQMVDEQEARGLINYIHENAPDLYESKKLEQMSLDELKKIKEGLDELANSY